MQAESRLRAYREMVDQRLADLLPPEHKEPTELHAAMRYSCLAPGKRLRPSLCLAAAEAVFNPGNQPTGEPPRQRDAYSQDQTAPFAGGVGEPAPSSSAGLPQSRANRGRGPERGTFSESRSTHPEEQTPNPEPRTPNPERSVLDAACALEMVHCFSLIHDDLPSIDDDDLRRGMPTCHVKFGEALALLAGDALFALAFEALANVAAESDRVVRAIRILAKATGSDGLVGGEVADVLSEGRTVDAGTLEMIHVRKTGALIAASCEIGAILGGGQEEQVATLRRFGEEVGLAFQIIDDVLNETSTPEKLGKATGSDRTRAKATYPRLYGLEESKASAEQRLAKAQELLRIFPEDSVGPLSALARFSVERLH